MDTDILKSIDQRAFGYRVHTARIEAHLSVGDLADRMGVSDIFLRQIEMGRKLPSLTVFLNMCNGLHIAPNYFLSTDLDIDLADPVQTAIDVIANCSPQEGILIMALIDAAKKNLPNKEVE